MLAPSNALSASVWQRKSCNADSRSAARVTAAPAAETIVEEDTSAEDRVFQEATATVERRFSPKAAAASAAYKAPRPPCGKVVLKSSSCGVLEPSRCRSESCAPLSGDVRLAW
jgi:hypothetical protein